MTDIPESIALSQDVQSDQQKRRKEQRYTARCHVFDVCQTLAASMMAPCPGNIYNVVDDDPSPRSQVASYARELLSGSTRQLETSVAQVTLSFAFIFCSVNSFRLVTNG